MQFSSLFVATLALVSAAPLTETQQGMTGVEGAVTNARQVQDTLNRQLGSDNGAHANQARVNAFITGADSQIDNTIATVSQALSPLTFGLSQAVGNFLLGPFVQSVTNGAEVFLSNIIGGGEDMIDAQLAASLTGSYSRLAAFASKNNVDSSRLQHLTEEITKAASGKAKRDEGGMSGIKGAITNIKQTFDTMKNDMEHSAGHAAQDTILAFITGADSQIDNAAATVAKALNGVTLGLSGDIGDFLLGPLVQSVTNGAEVLISNVIGGAIDIVTDGTAKLFSESLGKLHDLAVKMDVSSKDTDALAKVQKRVAHLKAPKKSEDSKNAKDSKDSKAKRASDSDMAGINGSLTNSRQVQDTLNSQLASHNGHAAEAVLNAFITGADSQIDNAIATVSDALAPYTLGLSKAIGNVLLGPFVQSVTNGAEVFIANLIGGGIDVATNGAVQMYNDSLGRLISEATKYGISTDNLSHAQSQLSKYISKRH